MVVYFVKEEWLVKEEEGMEVWKEEGLLVLVLVVEGLSRYRGKGH